MQRGREVILDDPFSGRGGNKGVDLKTSLQYRERKKWTKPRAVCIHVQSEGGREEKGDPL